MTLRLAYIVTLASIPVLLSAPPGGSTADRVAWLKSNSTAIRSIDPHDDDYSDLRPLTPSIGTSRIVLLGGSTEAPVVKAKFRLVRFLHEELGFDVLASSLPLLSLMEAEDLDREFERGRLFPAIHPFVLEAFAIREDPRMSFHSDIVDYVHATHRKGHPLHLAGFGAFFLPDMQIDYPRRLFQLIDRIDAKLCSPADRRAIKAMLMPRELGKQLTDARAAVDRLDDNLRRLPAGNPNAREVSFYRQTLAIVANEYAGVFGQNVSRDPDVAVWYAKEWRPESKIIIWADNTWIARYLNGPRRPDGQGPSWLAEGNTVAREFGAAAYSLAFAENPAYRDQVLEVMGAKPAADDFDSLCHAAGRPYSFLDFRSLPRDHWLRQPMTARFKSRGEVLTWPEIYDGMISIDGTLTSDHPPKASK